MPRYKYGDIVYIHGDPAVVQMVQERNAGFAEYFITFSTDSAMWVQENELDDESEIEEAEGVREFVVIYDGASRPMIETPNGRLLSISEFRNGRWGSYGKEDSDCRMIVAALNWILTHEPNILGEEIL